MKDKPDIIIIAAMTRDRVIGKQSKLPWHIPGEYRQFLDFIQDQTIIMGRKSFLLFKNGITSKYTIVLSRQQIKLAKAIVCPSFQTAILKAQRLGRTIFIGGGAEVYREALPVADYMYLSFIKRNYQGNTFFPEFDANQWDVMEKKDHQDFEFVIFGRK